MNAALWKEIGEAIWETLAMVGLSSFAHYLVGLPLGIALYVTGKNGLHPAPWFNIPVGFLVNILRSIPFLIFAVMLIPFARLLVGSSIGWPAMTVCLAIASAPYIARLVEQSIGQVPQGEIEAARSMGCSLMQIINKVVLKESTPSLLVSMAIGITTILAYSSMSGVFAGGGLGQVALTYGYYRSEDEVMYWALLFMVILTQIIQESGLWLARKFDRTRKN